MGIELVSLLVIIIIAIGGYFIFLLYTRAQRRKHEALHSPKKFEAWMAAQDFVPEQASFFLGTGIAIKESDERIVIYLNGEAAFYPITQLASVQAHRAIEAVRPLGAAPGVVEKRDILRFHLDLTFNAIKKPVTILVETPDLMHAWENRLNARIS